jgi:hypothetical protein
MTDRDKDQRLASGWGRRQAKQPQREPPTDQAGREAADEAGRETPGEAEARAQATEDLDLAGEEGAITGRAASRDPDQLATGNTAPSDDTSRSRDA